ncbi:MAG: glycine--tRNA ligase, partial [Candidatus Kariarchaeaceae archaeon]
MSDKLQDEIIDVCLRRGIIFPTAEIYNPAAGFYEYGPIGAKLRENVIALWQQTFVNSEDNVYEISGSTIIPEEVFKASGHLDGFNDPLTQCEKCKSMHRVDHVIEDATGQSVEGKPLEDMFEIIKSEGVTCPKCQGALQEPRNFNMMFKTEIGPTGGNTAYLRPETAQNIFLNFRRISHAMRAKLPFGVAQIGRAYRNEISPRNFLIRMREFEQLELEMFVDPDEINNHPGWHEIEDTIIRLKTHEIQDNDGDPMEISIKDAFSQGLIPNQYIGYYLAIETDFVTNLGIPFDQFYFRHLKDQETAHYSAANYDLEIQFPFGIVECIGLAYRTDYDLKKHSEMSGTKLQINQPGKGNLIPHVIEPSAGLTRLIYAILLASYVKDDREWDWFKFNGTISPWEIVVLPLMKKDGLAEAAKNLYWELKDHGLEVIYDESGKIGKRYARSDEIGVSYSVTVDYT